MLECLIIGDSIAVGTKQFAPQCELVGKGGINTWQFNRDYRRDLSAKHVIISLGTNDHSGVNTRKELESTRSRIAKDSRVFWILPAIKPNIQGIVRDIAAKYGDTVISTLKLDKDGIHPSWSGYKDLAEYARKN